MGIGFLLLREMDLRVCFPQILGMRNGAGCGS